MGFLKRQNQFSKQQQKELEAKVEEFKKKILEVSNEYGMQLIPIITKYGLAFEVQPQQKPNEIGKQT